jgi:hypothetical protein
MTAGEYRRLVAAECRLIAEDITDLQTKNFADAHVARLAAIGISIRQHHSGDTATTATANSAEERIAPKRARERLIPRRARRRGCKPSPLPHRLSKSRAKRLSAARKGAGTDAVPHHDVNRGLRITAMCSHPNEPSDHRSPQPTEF